MTDRDLNDNATVWHTDSQVSDVPSINYEVYTDEDAIEELHGPMSWTGPALGSAIFCFLPTGLIAYYNARKAKKSFEAGDMQSWTRYRGRARFLVFVTCILGILVYIVIIGVVQGVKHTSTT